MASAESVFSSFKSHASNYADYSSTGRGTNHASGVVGGTNAPHYTPSGLSHVTKFNYDYSSDSKPLIEQAVEHLSTTPSTPNYSSWGYDMYSGSASGSTPATPQILNYLDAPYASAYGMDASTAYNEALANTAYQRKVKDLLAAGLNPVLGISGSGADNFYGTPLQVLSDGSSYSGGSSYGSSGSGKDTLGKFGEQLLRNSPTIVGGLVTAVTKNFTSGYAASQVMQGISNIIRYS